MKFNLNKNSHLRFCSSNSILTNNLINIKNLIDHNILPEDGKLQGNVLNSNFPVKFSPWFITGFTDAEGYFGINMFTNERALAKTGIRFRFRIELHSKDIVLLCAIKNFFKVGNISKIRKNKLHFIFEVSSIDEINNVIIPFFDKYPLKGSKYFDYILWRDAFKDFLENRDNLDSKLLLISRLNKIKENLNLKNSKNNIPNEHLINIDPNYISGFISGDGSFSVTNKPETAHKGFGITTFNISQIIRNEALILAIQHFFKGIGRTHILKAQNKNSQDVILYTISEKKLLQEIIIPFFDKYPVYGLHSISFLKWKYIINIQIKNKTEILFSNKEDYISHIIKIWNNNTSCLFTDLSIENKDLKKEMKD
jgi:LAGLIDADG endonuclease